MFKKIYILLTILALTIVYAACSKDKPQSEANREPEKIDENAYVFVNSNNYLDEPQELEESEVSFILKTNHITTGTSWIDYEISNKTNVEFFYGEDFLLFKKSFGEWEYTDMLPDAKWNEIGVILTPDSINGGSIDIGYFFGELEAGEYRLEKDIFSDYKVFVLAAEFTVAAVEK